MYLRKIINLFSLEIFLFYKKCNCFTALADYFYLIGKVSNYNLVFLNLFLDGCFFAVKQPQTLSPVCLSLQQLILLKLAVVFG